MQPQDKHLAEPKRITLRDGREMTIRLLSRDDGESFARFYMAIPPQDSIYYMPPSARTREKSLARVAAADSPVEVCLVIVDDAGSIHGEAWFRWKADQLDRSMFGIAVGRSLQGVGAGRLIMTRLLEIGDTYGPPTMYLTVQTENERAWKLYSSLGFQTIRQQTRPQREDAPPMPEYYMERPMGRRQKA